MTSLLEARARSIMAANILSTSVGRAHYQHKGWRCIDTLLTRSSLSPYARHQCRHQFELQQSLTVDLSVSGHNENLLY